MMDELIVYNNINNSCQYIMNQKMKTNNLSKVDHSSINIPAYNYQKYQEEIKKVKYPVQAISAAQDI